MNTIQKAIKEIPIFTTSDCFTIVSRDKKNFDSTVHCHDVFELNLLMNMNNAERIVGDHTELIGNTDLVLIGPNVSHAWITNRCISGGDMKEVTIHFPKDLFDDKLLEKSQLFLIRNMLENAHRGVLFPTATIKKVAHRILQLDKKSGFDSVLEFLSIFHDLSISRNMQMLSSSDFFQEKIPHEKSRLEKVFDYLNTNYEKQITLADIAKMANMTETSTSRLIKNQTGSTFIDHLNHIRLSNATKMLSNSNYTISEIANFSGYLNISNFNRIFKSRKNCTPKEYRETYATKKEFLFS